MNRISLIVLVAGCAGVPAMGQTYSVEELAPLAGGTNSYGYGINDAGVVVGQSGAGGGVFPATMWVNGSPQGLGNLSGYATSVGWSINNQNQVVGDSYTNQSFDFGVPFVWEAGVMTALPVPAELPGGLAWQINDSGEAAGGVWPFGGATRTACVWRKGPSGWTYTLLPTLGGTSAWAIAINSEGVVVGFAQNSSEVYRACRWDPSLPLVATELPTPAGVECVALGIDALGRIVGGNNNPFTTGWVYSGGMMAVVSPLPGYDNIGPYRINKAGTIAGHAYNGDPHNLFGTFNDSRAIVWRSGATLDVNTLVAPPDSSWELRQIWDINSAGHMAGLGRHDGLNRAFRLVPCDANCDSSVVPPLLNVNDFACFMNKFAAGDSYANCDGSSLAPVLNVNDFTCFVNKFAAGCP